MIEGLVDQFLESLPVFRRKRHDVARKVRIIITVKSDMGKDVFFRILLRLDPEPNLSELQLSSDSQWHVASLCWV